MASDFTARALLKKGEARVFAELDKLVIARNPGWQVMAQVSVGEFVGSSDAAAEALRKAGIGYHEVVAGHTTPSELRRLVEKLVPDEG